MCCKCCTAQYCAYCARACNQPPCYSLSPSAERAAEWGASPDDLARLKEAARKAHWQFEESYADVDYEAVMATKQHLASQCFEVGMTVLSLHFDATKFLFIFVCHMPRIGRGCCSAQAARVHGVAGGQRTLAATVCRVLPDARPAPQQRALDMG